MFEMLVGDYPFSGKTREDIQRKIRKGSYEFIDIQNVSQECIEFLTLCL